MFEKARQLPNQQLAKATHKNPAHLSSVPGASLLRGASLRDVL